MRASAHIRTDWRRCRCRCFHQPQGPPNADTEDISTTAAVVVVFVGKLANVLLSQSCDRETLKGKREE